MTSTRAMLLPRRSRYIVPAGAAMLAVTALALHRSVSPLHFLMLLGASVLLVVLALSDARTMLLPNRLMYPALAGALLLASAWPHHSWASSLVGGAAGGAFMLLLFLVVPGFGFGDVKLCALIGLLVGWPEVLGALLAGIVCSGLLALALIAFGKAGRRTTMPYGPGLVAGALYVLLLVRP